MEEEEVTGGGRLRVLVVDDSPLDRRIVEMLLRRCHPMMDGVDVATNRFLLLSGKKAMEVLGFYEEKIVSPIDNAQKIDLILTDYCMPEMNGYDLLKIVKEQSCLMSIPVVIMSSENVPERISRCRSIGAEDFIMKPLKAKDVRMLRNYARPTVLTPKPGSKRKMPLDLLPESNSLERRTCLAGVVEHEYANCPPFSAYTLA